MAVSEPDAHNTHVAIQCGDTRSAWVPVVIARQPILDRQGDVRGFELLYRTAYGAARTATPEQATGTVMLAGLADIGLDLLVGDRPAYINVTRQLLLDLDPLPLPPHRVVLELLEDQLVDQALITALRELVARGFRIALDDFVLTSESEQLLEFAKVVKLDIRAMEQRQLRDHVRRLSGRGLILLAEKVETREEHTECMRLGFDAFQGYYYARPQLLTATGTPTQRFDVLNALLQIGAPLTSEDLEDLITQDVGLSHRFLRLANSAYHTSLRPVGSIREGLASLGTVAVRQWVVVMALARLADRPGPLLTLGLQRARTCELLAQELLTISADRSFTVGLLSILDALVGRSMEALLEELPLDERIKQALLLEQGKEGALLKAVLDYERGDLDAGRAAGIDPLVLSCAHRRALRWADMTAVLLA